MLSDSPSSVPPLSDTASIAREILREKGLQGFWSGYSASLILTLNPSITMLLHKVLLRLLVPRARRDDPGARFTFFLAAISKSLASTITYPFSLAKTRAQVSSQKPSSATGETSEKDSRAPDSKVARARQRTVFSTILRIVETEGIWGMYQGLGAEVVKGFFSHGITMLMKDRIHAVIISLYYSVLKAINKIPSTEEMTAKASDTAGTLYQQGKEQATEVYTKGANVAEQATETVKEAVQDGSQRASNLLESAKEQAGNIYESGGKVAESASSQVTQATESASKQATAITERGREVVSNASNESARLVQNGKENLSNVELLEKSKGGIGDVAEHAEGAAQTGRDAAANVGQRVSELVKEADVKDINGPDTGIKK